MNDKARLLGMLDSLQVGLEYLEDQWLEADELDDDEAMGYAIGAARYALEKLQVALEAAAVIRTNEEAA